MSKIYTKNLLGLLFVVLFTFSSCVKDNFDLDEKFSDEIEWNPSMALPIATADLTLANLAKERQDTLQHIGENTLGYGSNADDKVVQFVYTIDTARVIDVMHLPILDPFDTIVYLKPVSIEKVSFPIGYVTVDDLIKDNFSSSDYNEFVADAADGKVSLSEKTAITQKKYPIGDVPESVKSFIKANFGTEINVKDVFEYIVLKSGTITLSCTNSSGFNFYCDVVIESKNKNGEWVEFGSFDYSGFPSWISQGGPQKQSFEADSSYLNSDFYYSFKNLRIGQSSNVVTNMTNMGLLLNIEMNDMVAYAGKAYVPEQELALDTTVYMTMKDEDANRKLFNVLVADGAFHYELESTIGIATEFIAEFPSISNNGIPGVRKYAAMTNSKPKYSSDWSLNGENIDLTQNPNISYNSIPIKVGYRVHTTGGMLEFGAGQYISIHIENTDSVKFAYAEGDLGKFEQNLFSETLDFDLKDYLEDFVSGEFAFYDPKVHVSFDNPVGIGGDLQLDLVGKDDKGNVVDVFSGYTNKWRISRPTCEQVNNAEATTTEISVTNKTSNIVDFTKLLPKTIDYSGKFYVNSDVSDGSPILNCVSNKGTAKLGVQIELPMNLSVKDLVLVQTVNLDLSNFRSEAKDITGDESLTDGDLLKIERLLLYMDIEHQFPLDATLKVSMLDTTQPADKQYLGTLDWTVLEAAPTDASGKVSRNVKKTSHIEKNLTDDDDILKNFVKSNKLQLEVFLETDKNGDVPVIFYSYYGLKFNLSATCKFKYTSR